VQLSSPDLAFSPNKRGDFWVANSDKRIDGLGKLLCTRKACPAQGLALENAEPDFYLVEPACGGGRKVEEKWLSSFGQFFLFLDTVLEVN